MGFFDLFAAKKKAHPQPQPSTTVPPPAPVAPATPQPAPSNAQGPSLPPASPGSTQEQLLLARKKLEARDLTAAMAIYEELLAVHGDRTDVLVTLSGDLGVTGFAPQIIELLGPRYDAERHGPAAGLNLLQAYLLTRQPVPARHLLDVLYGLQRADLTERLHGFSNALAELIAASGPGEGIPSAPGQPLAAAPAAPRTVSLVSISRPLWSYGLESLEGLVPPAKEKGLRRIAFAQVSLLGQDAPQLDGPETAAARFCRGLPLWLAEMMYFSPHYAPIAAVGLLGNERLVNFPMEWTAEHLRQLVSSASEGLDYVVTGALRQQGETSELLLRLWEVRKMKERKQFQISWTPQTQDRELSNLAEQLRLFMEWKPYPQGPAAPAPLRPSEWIDSLGLSLGYFLAEKKVLPPTEVAPAELSSSALGKRAAASLHDSLVWLTVAHRAETLQIPLAAPDVGLAPHPLVAEAARVLQPQ